MRANPGFEEKILRPVYFLDIAFASGRFLANSADRNLTIGADLYYAVGSLGKIGEYITLTGVQASALKLTLSNIPIEAVGDIVNEETRNKRVKVAIALMDENHQLVTGLIYWFNGTIDSLAMEIGQSVSVALSASSRLLNWSRSVNSRYNNEDQQSKYPGDKGFKFISNLINLKIQWGT